MNKRATNWNIYVYVFLLQIHDNSVEYTYSQYIIHVLWIHINTHICKFIHIWKLMWVYSFTVHVFDKGIISRYVKNS